MSNLDDALMAATERARVFYGKVDYIARFVALKKGAGKVAFEESMSIEDQRTEIKISLNPLDETGMTRLVERTLIAESREYTKIVWGSLKSLGMEHIRELHNRFAKIELVPTGRTYAGRNGSEVEETTMKFLALYDSAEASLLAYRMDGGIEPEAKEQPAVDANNAERAVAAQFLPHLVKNANGNIQLLADSLRSMSPLNKYFNIDSPEVQKLLQEQK